ncbi:very-long-chain enoyl-CoA reductase-like [Saccoglossus kowalevskii]|uniref:Very-long-chain enoyl-CoA reductase-like n=1 Tax=Saccoglossus kowalevskii TaxID=10224 RepID=A0ABM0MTS4_SACKO|nr:PREDICTED: very-long-chain enoyl-CoA reductase-like [Saccoglossus kowalevskii]
MAAKQRSAAGFDPVVGSTLMYTGAVLGYGFGFFISGIHDLEVPFLGMPFIDNYRETYDPINDTGVGFSLFSLFFCGHFAKRILEVLFVHRYNHIMPALELLGGVIYYTVFSIGIAASLRVYISDQNVDFKLLSLGACIFIVGEIGNGVSHYQLRLLRDPRLQRKDDDTNARNRPIPVGWIFEYVSCPHYFFEIVSWLGFFVAVGTIPVLVFLIATTVIVSSKALKYHGEYKEFFNGTMGRKMYPPKRKAIIPFIL